MCVCSPSFSFAGLFADVEQHMAGICLWASMCHCVKHLWNVLHIQISANQHRLCLFLWNCYSEPSSGNKYSVTIKEMYILVPAEVDMHISDKCKWWHNYLFFYGVYCSSQHGFLSSILSRSQPDLQLGVLLSHFKKWQSRKVEANVSIIKLI